MGKEIIKKGIITAKKVKEKAELKAKELYDEAVSEEEGYNEEMEEEEEIEKRGGASLRSKVLKEAPAKS